MKFVRVSEQTGEQGSRKTCGSCNCQAAPPINLLPLWCLLLSGPITGRRGLSGSASSNLRKDSLLFFIRLPECCAHRKPSHFLSAPETLTHLVLCRKNIFTFVCSLVLCKSASNQQKLDQYVNNNEICVVRLSVSASLIQSSLSWTPQTVRKRWKNDAPFLRSFSPWSFPGIRTVKL